MTLLVRDSGTKYNEMITYNETKCGLSAYHDKQSALNDKIHKRTIQSNEANKTHYMSKTQKHHTRTNVKRTV